MLITVARPEAQIITAPLSHSRISRRNITVQYFCGSHVNVYRPRPALVTEFLQMDIFFFVATIGVAAVAGMAALLLWRLSRIAKQLERILGRVESAADAAYEEFTSVRDAFRSVMARIESFFTKPGTPTKKRST